MERLFETLAFIGESTEKIHFRAIILRQIEMVKTAAEETLETEDEKEKVHAKYEAAKSGF